MAKSRSFFGLRSGSTKTLTFQVGAGGVQITKDRVSNVKNPRTNRQQNQRAKFAECVAFYKRGIQALFKFAYEDKKPNESDYNAFMRHNVGRGVYMTPDQVNNENIPMAGSFVLTYGQLNASNITNPLVATNYILDRNGNELEVTASDIVAPADESDEGMTLGTFSKILLRSNASLADGDIVTFVVIGSNAQVTTTSPYISEASSLAREPYWNIYQFRIDSSSQDTSFLADETILVGNGQEVGTKLTLAVDNSVPATGCALIFSRETASGVIVSTQSIILTDALQTAVNTMRTDANWISFVENAWGASAKAILQGSLLGE